MQRFRGFLAGALATTLIATTATACSTQTSGSATTAAAATTAASGAPGSGAPVTNGAAQVKVTITGTDGDKCGLDFASAPAGPITFTVVNESSTAVSEFELLNNLKILGEKENLAPGLPAVNFTVTLGGGDYSIYCPGADPETTTFTVTGAAAAAPTGDTQALLQQGADEYGVWAAQQITEMQTAVASLQTAVESGDVAKAQLAYVQARPFYEKVESSVEGFVLDGFAPDDNKGNLDYLIDMRESSLDESVGWSGFHAVERDLFQAKAITDQTKTYAKDLTSNVGKLAELTKDLQYKPEDLANGAAGLLEEVQANKITGEEEAYSNIDLVDFANNLEGARQAYASLQPGMEKIDADLNTQIVAEFGKVETALNQYRDPQGLGGYIAWTPENRAAHSKELSQAVLNLQKPMQSIAEKVATAS
ncbi:peptidase M75 family protein [Micrococcales bacterium 31B]|nr:peptidase M75 family protein [Micrococcales bacterium 31B]